MNLGFYNAWCFARLLADHTLNGELDRIDDRFRALANRMNAAPLGGGRQKVFDGACAAWDDAVSESLVQDICNADPDGPEPADHSPEEWPPLRLGELPSVESFPVDVLPPPAADLVLEGASAIGCPIDFLGVPLLAVAAGAIGRSASLKLKDGYFVGACVFAAPVGPPSDGKTPALKAVSAPLRAIDEVLALEHSQAIERWKEEYERPGPDGKKQSKPPAPPRPRRIDVDDVTMEALPLILADNPRGLVMVRDELTALVMGLNQYKGGKGNDRAAVLKIWSGDALKKDRVAHENHEPIRCPHPMMSIVGGLPPDMLGEIVDGKGRADGFIERFLFAYPDSLPVPEWSNAGVPEVVAEGWRQVVGRLWSRPMNYKDGRDVPHVAFFTPAAAAAWRRSYDAHSVEMNSSDFPPTLRGAWGKLRDYAGRLALILELLHHAADPTADESAVPDVGERTVEDAWRLVAYFKSHARRVHSVAHSGCEGPEAKALNALVAWLREKGMASFNERDAKKAREWITPDDLSKALVRMVKANVIRPKDLPPPGSAGGRPKSPAYDVNPALAPGQNRQNRQNHMTP
ncbi:DUF3987 domain-containing protein [Paludisphaera mucosa]|uniref:DUF3987 domain-containing protein n=1 Tax=Paludisphaera mucosa TaxID=3030827 RepID=A0ABT6FET2_9BACT|nr:DUF3987 domain-containing protein [Paludisphaera mucosa]MDG3006081.1 DUF3987 domain-containing protein [Paludisphaera mucosa]